MSFKGKMLSKLQSKKANALLLATAGAIAATFSVYFFVSITTLSEESKQRVAHLYNAYQMGQSVKAKIDGTDVNEVRLGNLTEEQIEISLTSNYQNSNVISLQTMIDDGIIVPAADPTQTARSGQDTDYLLDDSTVTIQYLDSNGDDITADDASGSIVHDVQLLVNLAGTADADSGNGPYTTGEPFFYILMDENANGIALAANLVTIDDAVFEFGILDQTDGGPQPENSVVLPQDYD